MWFSLCYGLSEEEIRKKLRVHSITGCFTFECGHAIMTKTKTSTLV